MASAMRSIVRSNPGEGLGRAVDGWNSEQDRKVSLRTLE
jgi:hypothetical protein